MNSDPNGLDAHLLGRISANGLMGWWTGFTPGSLIDPQRLAHWVDNRSARGEGEVGQVGPVAGFRPKA
jgi:hypothetical protein